MNFLGHLYFSNGDHQLMHANLLGDFVKGSDLSMYPAEIEKGIRLHREIDHYVDHHPVVLETIHELYIPLPKVAGIAIDLYFDHVLSKRWTDYHEVPLTEFIQGFYESKIEYEEVYSPKYLYMLEKMRKKNWLEQYQYMSGLTKACQGVSRRISFPNSLTEGPAVFTDFEEKIVKTFITFMKDAIPHHKAFLNDL
ncbi:MAG: acyl carrier protein phosphodiesterase [Crocinitomicaceae bacterium]|jgi:acyl carrier protein phosphodiesterase